MPNLLYVVRDGFVALWRKVRFGTPLIPVPIHDHGHRCFLVPSDKAVIALGKVFAEHGLHERFTFDVGETTQTVFDDNTTVLMQITDETLRRELTPVSDVDSDVIGPCALSLTAHHPVRAAKYACCILRRAGFKARLNNEHMRELSDKFAIVETDACWGWSLCFRRDALAMGKPRNARRLINLNATGA
jgi:hypothetical protein